MLKRIFCILLSIIFIVGALTSCRSNKEILSGTSEYNVNELLDSSSELSSENKTTDEINSNNSDADKTDTDINKNESNKNNNKVNNTSSSKKEEGYIKPTNSEVDSTSSESVEKLVVISNESIYKDYPELTHDYLLPPSSVVNVSKNDSKIYENKYVKVDATTSKDGYLLISYKDPWAAKIQVSLDETAVHSGMYQKTHHSYYNKGDFANNQPIALALPKTDAIYYLVISSQINGVESIKFCVDLGQITVDGYASYQDMVPTEEQIKLTEVSSGIYSNKYVKINVNTASKGYVEVEYIEPTAFDIVVSLCSDKKNQQGRVTNWTYDTKMKGNCKIKAALTYGNAKYTITVVSAMRNESTKVGRASKKAELTVNLNNVSPTAGFLLSTGEVLFNSDMMFIKKAAEISATCSNDFEKVSKIYDWLTQYIQYKITDDTTQGLYVCDLEKIYNRKTGVCYDYAVVLAAMLRSQGIPCKAVFGKYANVSSTDGHVWNEVYIASSGEITSNEISITGNKWCRLDPTLSHGSSGQAAIDYMNDDSNYIWESYY